MIKVESKFNVIQELLGKAHSNEPKNPKGLAYAPTNIALCKYWGKRDVELNLPVTSSLSIALPDKGTMTSVTVHDKPHDIFVLNGQIVPSELPFAKRASEFLDLFRSKKNWHLHVDIKMNIPVAAGLASSASGFASLTLALNDLLGWQFEKQHLSIIARLGSGSAARSLWNGFVEWHAGVSADGMDSFAKPILTEWPELCIGILTISEETKSISSRDAMQRTVNSSSLYANWPKKVAHDLVLLRQAIQTKNFSLLAGTSESNALTMHATMLSSWPPICYYLPATVQAMHQVWELRRNGVEVYFTQDAGANLKLLFLEKNTDAIKQSFPAMEQIRLFESEQ